VDFQISSLMKFPLLLLWIMLSSANGVAATAATFPAGAQAEWNKYFLGTLVMPDPETNLERMLNAPNPSCVDQQKKVIALTVQYGRDGYNSDNSKTKKEAEAILKFLQGLESSNDPCFDSVARAYLAASVHLLNPANSSTTDVYNDYKLNNHPYPMGLELTLLSAALLNHKNKDGSSTIEFLTPLRRTQEQSKVWNQKIQGGDDYLVSAGYDCVQRKILIDPYLPPLNLAGTFVHELDHMFRDRDQIVDTINPQEKIYYELRDAQLNLNRASAIMNGDPSGAQVSSQISPQISGDPLDSHLPLKLALDETLASAMSAYYQRHIRSFRDYRSSFKGWVLGRSAHHFPFALTDDLSLYRNDDKGPINEIWHLLTEMKIPEIRDGEINLNSEEFLLLTFLRGDPFRQPTDKFPPPTSEIQEIYQTIYRGYFNGQSMTAADFSLVDPSQQGSTRDPFSKWLNRYAVVLENDLAGQQSMINKSLDWITINPAENGMGAYQVGANLEDLFAGLDSVFSQFFDSDALSPYCSGYLAGLQNGELDSYVGNKLSSGYKPGETGVKPGETGVKPGETGVKPGETGVKPGETGVKPELFRPCLNIGPEL
jgi:hypothetical protein